MMGDMTGQVLWGEPWAGTLFGNFYYVAVDEKKHRAPQFIMGRHRESWLWSIRNFVLDAAVATFPKLGREDYLVIKEPNGSVGAPLMMEAMPESRMVLLARDPRDVVASSLDARRKGGWHFERNKKLRNGEKRTLAEEAPLTFARKRAEGCLQQMGKAKDAFDAHGGRKALVRYEELRMDTLGTMRRMYSELEIEVDEDELTRTVEKHSWENIPAEEKGPGKFYREATPGGWKEDLTLDQVKTVERITAPLLAEFYPS